MKQSVIYKYCWTFALLLLACSKNDVALNDNVNEQEDSIELFSDEVETIPVSNIRHNNTRTLYSFNSENLKCARWFEKGDYYMGINPYMVKSRYDSYYASQNYKMQRYYYLPTENVFTTVNASMMSQVGTPFKTHLLWTIYDGHNAVKIGGVTQKIQTTDTIMFAVFDKHCSDLYWSPEHYNPTDTTIVLGLTKQLGTKNDCFSRQVPWCRYPQGQYTGIHIWNDLTAYYWLQILYDSTKVASIDTVHMHADEGLASKLYFKYDATVSMDCTIWDGPYAIGVDTMFALKGHEYGQGVGECNKRADVFISFFPGLKSNNIFHNFGFDVGWTDKFGNKHYTYEPMNREDVRPQAKVASPGNVYRDAMTLTLEHGLQNMWEDEVIEIDKWNTKVDSTIIIKKD